jgi:hypothetical protein
MQFYYEIKTSEPKLVRQTLDRSINYEQVQEKAGDLSLVHETKR